MLDISNKASFLFFKARNFAQDLKSFISAMPMTFNTMLERSTYFSLIWALCLLLFIRLLLDIRLLFDIRLLLDIRFLLDIRLLLDLCFFNLHVGEWLNLALGWWLSWSIRVGRLRYCKYWSLGETSVFGGSPC